ncbi:VUT family protein [Saccharothrix sp.]|uniref:VUT family protein n=1 Tax=Saccharothrix sp. TaxID=1873460 RepID=UPI0028116329|nr:VUT family protein [Saccharothrix sp.]
MKTTDDPAAPTGPPVTVLLTTLAYLASVFAANWTSTHWPPLTVTGLVVPAGTLFAGATLALRDLIHETLGTVGLTAALLAGAALSALLASPRIALASVAAFTLSELLDTAVYARLRRRSRPAALVASNLVGLVVDSAVFVPLAFATLTALPGQLVGKTAATLLALAALCTARRVRRR